MFCLIVAFIFHTNAPLLAHFAAAASSSSSFLSLKRQHTALASVRLRLRLNVLSVVHLNEWIYTENPFK